jgi:hypothetical protein
MAGAARASRYDTMRQRIALVASSHDGKSDEP